MERAVVVDVDGVVSPVHGRSAWGDDVVAGNVFGPVYVSPMLCAELDALHEPPSVSCWWLTSWTVEMRASMQPFPGRDWRAVAEPSHQPKGRRWWKLVALEGWLAEHPDVAAVAWCDDHLASGSRRASVRRRLQDLGVELLPIAPAAAVGLTPHDLDLLHRWSS